MSATLLACAPGKHASVVVRYEVRSASEKWDFRNAGKEEIETAFKRFAEKHGYTCRADFKRPTNTRCRGPKDLQLEFQPSLNKPEFLATFGWRNSPERTEEEFARLVNEFRTYMGAVVGTQNVQLSKTK